MKCQTGKVKEGLLKMNENFLDSNVLLIFSMIISFVLATLYIRERIKNKAN